MQSLEKAHLQIRKHADQKQIFQLTCKKGRSSREGVNIFLQFQTPLEHFILASNEAKGKKIRVITAYN